MKCVGFLKSVEILGRGSHFETPLEGEQIEMREAVFQCPDCGHLAFGLGNHRCGQPMDDRELEAKLVLDCSPIALPGGREMPGAPRLHNSY